MARTGRRRKPGRVPGDLADPRGMPAHLAAFLEWMAVKGYAEGTVEKHRTCIGYFIDWCSERGVGHPGEVTRPVLTRYQRHLYHCRTKEGLPLSFRTQCSRLMPLKNFFRWLARNNMILYNPAADIELPRREKRLPRNVMIAAEAEAVIACADIATPLGIRDRAIMETLYSTGVRRSELVNLTLFDVDVAQGTVMVREGKGKKDRMIPIGDRALAWIRKYLADVRPMLAVEPDSGTLFLTVLGEPLSKGWLGDLIHGYVEKAGIGKKGSCHLFRHTMATLMLENGADIRFIQEMLGHEELSTTQIYTQVSIRKLKEVHTATHPAKMTREAARGTEDDDLPAGADDRAPSSRPANSTSTPPRDARTALLDAL